MKRLEIVDQGVLYRNPHPGHRAICAFLANVVPLGDDEILCFYRLGQAFYSHDGRLARLRSSDGGRSWNEEALVWDPRGNAGLKRPPMCRSQLPLSRVLGRCFGRGEAVPGRRFGESSCWRVSGGTTGLERG